MQLRVASGASCTKSEPKQRTSIVFPRVRHATINYFHSTVTLNELADIISTSNSSLRGFNKFGVSTVRTTFARKLEYLCYRGNRNFLVMFNTHVDAKLIEEVNYLSTVCCVNQENLYVWYG